MVLKAIEFWSEEWDKFYNTKEGAQTGLHYKSGLIKKKVYYGDEGKIYKTNEN